MKTKKEIQEQVDLVKQAIRGYLMVIYDEKEPESKRNIYKEAYNRLNAELAAYEWVLNFS